MWTISYSVWVDCELSLFSSKEEDHLKKGLELVQSLRKQLKKVVGEARILSD